MKQLYFFLGGCLLAVGCDNLAPPSTTTVTNRDNTAVNQRDADSRTMTPFDQSNTQADIDLVAKIRASVLEIKDLSINGRNVKIITNQGKVLLRGPVASSTERDAIEKVALDAAGAGNVTNNLEVDAD
jgi:hyperosmotically inducible periplasmic protein